MKFDILIIGAGPAGIFTALELKKAGSTKSIAILEKGCSMEKRSCPKVKTKKCVNCKPYCHITTGFSGAGAFSDGKLSLSADVGGELPELIGTEKTQELIEYTDGIYLEFGADSHVEGVENSDKIKEIRKRAIKANLKLVDCPIRHLGTESAQQIYLGIQNYLKEHGVVLYFDTSAKDLAIENGICTGVLWENVKTKTEGVFEAETVVVATGREGADWLEHQCSRHKIAHHAGTVDIGVRVEVRNEVMEEVNNVLYESKLIGYPQPFCDKVRTFCQNPGGYVSQENYANNLAVVNGHSYKHKKSLNTNLAILCSHKFSDPFDQPIEFAKKVSELVNMLGDGSILVQRYGDILEGKRTWQEELDRANVRPTLPDAKAGDITSAMPYRTMTGILKFIESVDTVVPGFASRETLLYAPEVKFYSNQIKLDSNLKTNIKGLYCLGDSSGWTRGLMMASVMGVMTGRMLK